MMVGGSVVPQTEHRDDAEFSAQIFQFNELVEGDEYEGEYWNSDWESDWDSDNW